jgi:multiple antibiotic resistance protein
LAIPLALRCLLVQKEHSILANGYSFERGYPKADTAKEASDDSGFSRAAQAYRFSYPTVSTEGIMNGNRSIGSLRPQVLASFVLLGGSLAASAQQITANATGQAQSVTFSLGKVFTFLFLTLGPLKLLGPFVQMTRGRDEAFRRGFAFRGSIIALVAIVFAAFSGAATLHKWGVSVGSLLLTGGLILFLVALKPVLEEFAPESRVTSPPAADASPPSPMKLAFPTIVTPYGIAILIVLVTLRPGTTAVEVLGVAIFILLLDLMAMLFAQQILNTPLVPLALGIVGPVMGVLQVALGVSTVVLALHLLGFKS